MIDPKSNAIGTRSTWLASPRAPAYETFSPIVIPEYQPGCHFWDISV